MVTLDQTGQLLFFIRMAGMDNLGYNVLRIVEEWFNRWRCRVEL